MAQKRKRDWRERDHIQQAIERGHIADIRADLETQPTLPDSEEKDPLFNRGFYSIKLSKASASKLKKAAEHEVISEQWYDFQHNLNEPDYEQAIDDVPQASFAMQDAFVEVLKMQPLQIAIVILDVDSGADFEEFASTFLDYPLGADHAIGKDAFLRDGIMTTCGVMRKWSFLKTVQRLRDDEGHFSPATTPTELAEDGSEIIVEGRWKDRLVDDIIEQYPDDYPCMVLFSRKIIYGASLVFVQGDDEPGDNTLLGQTMTAQDAAEFDPRVAFWIAQNALRPTDGWLALTIPRSAIQGWIEDTINIYDPPGAGPGNPGDGPFPPGEGGDPPPVDPGDGGVDPPPTGGGGGGGGGTVPTPPDGTGDRATFDCTTEILFQDEGTNHTYSLADFSWNQNGGWLFAAGLQAFVPVNALDVQADIFANIATAVEAWRVANGKSSNYEIRRVQICVSYTRMKRLALLLDGQESWFTMDFDRLTGNIFFGFTDPRPRLHVQRSSAGTDKYAKGEIKRLGEYDFGVAGFELQAVADVEIANQVHVTVTNYQTVTGLVFYALLVAAAWDFFNSKTDTPIITIGLESADIYYEVSAWTAHFNLDTMAAHILVNPHDATQTLYFSDNPDGTVNGRATGDLTPKILPNPNNVTGTKNGVLLQGGIGFAISELDLIDAVDGYTPNCDANYTKATLTMNYAGGGACSLEVRRTPGGTGYVANFTLPIVTIDSGASTPTDQTEQHTVEIDISAVGLLTGDTLHNVSLVTSAGVFFTEWRIVLS